MTAPEDHFPPEDEKPAPDLEWVVEYRGIYQPNGSWPAPHNWRVMAAFDGELAAERYAKGCENETWEYRHREQPMFLPYGPAERRT